LDNELKQGKFIDPSKISDIEKNYRIFIEALIHENMIRVTVIGKNLALIS
jgi:hypothetical protein